MKFMLLLLLPTSLLAITCPKGFIEYNGICAADPQPVETLKGDNPSWVSSEKPSRHPEPAYQRGDVHTIEIKPQETERDASDAQIKFATEHGTATKSNMQ